jgi:hypothetical protein
MYTKEEIWASISKEIGIIKTLRGSITKEAAKRRK